MQELILGHPKVVGIVGLVFALLFGAVAVSSFLEMQRLPASPQRVSMSEAAALAPTAYNQRPWVEIADGILDCKNLRHAFAGDSERTRILFADENRTMVVVAEYSGQKTCRQIAAANPSGLLSRMSDTRYERFLEANEFNLSGYKDAAVFMDLCAFCGRGNSQLGVILGGVMAVVALSLYPLCLWMRKKVEAEHAELLSRDGTA